jgi:hypothetical protein
MSPIRRQVKSFYLIVETIAFVSFSSFLGSVSCCGGFVYFFRRAGNLKHSATKLEQRVNVLERQLRQINAELKAVRVASRRAWWKALAGRFKNDPLFDKVTEAGKAYRRSLSHRAG